MSGSAPTQRCTQAGWEGHSFRRCDKPATTWFRTTWPEPEEYIDYRCDLHASWLKDMQRLHESGPIGTEPLIAE